MSKSFDSFLEDKFMSLREIGGQGITKDNYESLFESWVENLDTSDVMDFAEEYGMKNYLEGKEEILNGLAPHIKNLRDLESKLSDLKVKNF